MRHDGWFFHPYVWLELVNGHPAAVIQGRHEILLYLYSANPVGTDDEVQRRLDEARRGREIFVVARNEGQKLILERRPFLRKMIEEGSWAVYKLRSDKQ